VILGLLAGVKWYIWAVFSVRTIGVGGGWRTATMVMMGGALGGLEAYVLPTKARDSGRISMGSISGDHEFSVTEHIFAFELTHGTTNVFCRSS